MALAACLAMVIAAGPGLGLFYPGTTTPPTICPGSRTASPRSCPRANGSPVANPACSSMKSRAITIEVQLTQTDTAANAGDLYSGGVRWYLQPTTAPVPPGIPAEAWAQRETLGCVTWN